MLSVDGVLWIEASSQMWYVSEPDYLPCPEWEHCTAAFSVVRRVRYAPWCNGTMLDEV